jgi:TldD protein
MNTDSLVDALLHPYELQAKHVLELLGHIHRPQCDDADIFIQRFADESWVLEDGIIKEAACSVEQGAGFRCVMGQTTGYAYSEDFSWGALQSAARAASTLATSPYKPVAIPAKSGAIPPSYYASIDPLAACTDANKVQILHDLERYARAASPTVEKVIASLSSRYEQVLIQRYDGALVSDVRPLVRVAIQVVCVRDQERHSGSSSVGGRAALTHYTAATSLQELAQEAVRLASLPFGAQEAPAGELPVVLGPGWPGVLLHEAVGHGLEGDFHRKATSAFSNRIGQQVASSVCTVIDDATIPDRRGSLTIDDEGMPGERTVLIENGILKQVMQDRQNGRLMGMASTGNGRRESYEYLPMPRMTNTFLAPGPHEPEAIIASVEEGIYAVNFSGGQVDITSGKFVFTANEAYRIKKGKIQAPIKAVTLTGDGAEVMQQISMLGNDLALDPGIGVCDKEGQSVPVGVGQPTLRIDKITVGGTQQ